MRRLLLRHQHTSPHIQALGELVYRRVISSYSLLTCLFLLELNGSLEANPACTDREEHSVVMFPKQLISSSEIKGGETGCKRFILVDFCGVYL